MKLEIKYRKEPNKDLLFLVLSLSILFILAIMAMFNHFGGYGFFVVLGYMFYVVLLEKLCRIKIRRVEI